MDRYIIAFILFSFLGWVWESIYCTACNGKWANRGFLYGPICPIYGTGSMLALILFDLVQKGTLSDLSPWLVFLLGILASAVLEYPTSYILEKLFHARWWDYSKVPLNVNGRISLPTAVGFGAVAVLLFKVLLPLYSSVFGFFPEWFCELCSFVFIALLSADTTLTVSALTDFQKRVRTIDESFQENMSENVYKLLSAKNRLHQKALDRIVSLRFAKSRLDIAKKLMEARFEELVKRIEK